MSDAAPALGTPDLADRVNDVKAWALSRIRTCREQETKFAGAWKHREKHHTGPPQALVEAWTERRALQAVLKMLSPGYLERVEHGYGHTGDGDQRMKTTVTTEEIVAAIRGGEHKFEGIRRRLGVRAIDFRVVDRALQKARKAGLIRYERGRGWEVVERPNSTGER